MSPLIIILASSIWHRLREAAIGLRRVTFVIMMDLWKRYKLKSEAYSKFHFRSPFLRKNHRREANISSFATQTTFKRCPPIAAIAFLPDLCYNILTLRCNVNFWHRAWQSTRINPLQWKLRSFSGLLLSLLPSFQSAVKQMSDVVIAYVMWESNVNGCKCNIMCVHPLVHILATSTKRVGSPEISVSDLQIHM